LSKENADVDSHPGSVQTLNLNILSAIICSVEAIRVAIGREQGQEITVEDRLIS